MRRPDFRPILAGGRRRRLAAGIALIATVGVVIAVVLSSGSTNPTTSSSNTAQASGSTTVQRRDLVATDTQSGTLGYANPQTVYNRLSGTITWLPSVGQVIKPGQTLYEVNGQPVILLDGTTPAFRDLNASDTAGQDILQLNRSLVALGFNPEGIVVDDTWQVATTAGVDMWQASLGEAETGSLSLGQIVFLPGEQLVSSLAATLGDGGSGSTGGAPASARPAAAGSELVSLTTTTPRTTTPTSTEPTTTKPKPTKPHPTKPHPTRRLTAHKPSGSTSSRSLAALTALLKAEAAQLKAATAALKAAKAASSRSSTPSSASKTSGSPSSSSSSSSSASSGGGSASAVLQTASRQLIATVDLDASKQSEAKVGEKVTVQMPAGNTVNGVITAVSSVAQSSSSAANGASPSGAGSANSNGSSGSSGATIPVTIRLKGHIGGAGLDQAAVSVNFIQAVAKNVLSVPVTALLATSGGGYAVKEATAPDKLIPVTTGLFAAGYVEISGQGIDPGLAVTDSQG
jgi:hypothetical protein